MALEIVDTSVLVGEYGTALFDLAFKGGNLLVCDGVVFEELEVHARYALCFPGERYRLGGQATECEGSLGIRRKGLVRVEEVHKAKHTPTLSLNGIKPAPWIFLRDMGSIGVNIVTIDSEVFVLRRMSVKNVAVGGTNTGEE